MKKIVPLPEVIASSLNANMADFLKRLKAHTFVFILVIYIYQIKVI